MEKLILISVLLATVLLPLRAAADPHPRRALRRCIVGMVVFNGLYVLALMMAYPRVARIVALF